MLSIYCLYRFPIYLFLHLSHRLFLMLFTYRILRILKGCVRRINTHWWCITLIFFFYTSATLHFMRSCWFMQQLLYIVYGYHTSIHQTSLPYAHVCALCASDCLTASLSTDLVRFTIMAGALPSKLKADLWCNAIQLTGIITTALSLEDAARLRVIRK